MMLDLAPCIMSMRTPRKAAAVPIPWISGQYNELTRYRNCNIFGIPGNFFLPNIFDKEGHIFFKSKLITFSLFDVIPCTPTDITVIQRLAPKVKII